MKVLLSLVFVFLAVTVQCWAEEFRFDSAGLRYGRSLGGRAHEFQQAEVFADWDLPWAWHFAEHWSLDTGFSGSAGWLNQHNVDGFIGSLGPTLTLRRHGFPLTVIAGASGTVLSETSYETKEFGTPFEFISHVGLRWEPVEHVFVGYRYQHMSNAGLSHFNPGLNLHMLCLGFHF